MLAWISLPGSGSAWRELSVLPTALATLFALSLAVGIAANATFRFDRSLAEAPKARGLPVYFVTPRGIANPVEILEVAPRFAPKVYYCPGYRNRLPSAPLVSESLLRRGERSLSSWPLHPWSPRMGEH